MLYPLIETSFNAYNACAAAGVALAILLLMYNLSKDSVLPKERQPLMYVVGGVAFLVGGAAANVGNWFLFPKLLEMPLWDRITNAGFTFYAGIIGFFLAAAVLLKIFKFPIRYGVNLLIPSVLLFHAVGRIGCSLAGCCYGIEGPFHFGALVLDRFPAREIESLCLFAFAAIAQFAFRKRNYGRFLFYLIAYPVARFIIEFFRGDERGRLLVDFLSPAQVISVVALCAVLVYVICHVLNNRRIKKDSESLTP